MRNAPILKMSLPLPRPKHYPVQYLLIPVRVLLGIPFILLLKIYILIGRSLIAGAFVLVTFIVFGSGRLVETYIWPGLFDSSILATVGTIVVLLVLAGITWTVTKQIKRLRKFQSITQGKHALGKKFNRVWDFAFGFLFEAQYKQSYAELFGPKFPEPTFEQFELEKEDYYAFNRRFSLKELTIGIAAVTGLGVSWLLFRDSPLVLRFAAWLLIAIAAAVILLCFEKWQISRYPQGLKSIEYAYALTAYRSIQEELRKAQFQKDWEAGLIKPKSGRRPYR